MNQILATNPRPAQPTVMLRSLWDNHHVPALHLLLLARYDGLADTRGEDEVLVDLVDLRGVSASAVRSTA